MRSRPKRIFVAGVGQHDNIGDIILRRELVDWLQSEGTLHIYVGRAPAGYADALGVRTDNIVYYSFTRWYLSMLRSALIGRAVYVFKPGEIQLTLLGLKEHVSVLPILLLIRMWRGGVVRVGSGARSFSPLPAALMRPSIALSNIVRWRDTGTAEYLHGPLMPDLAFGQGSSDALTYQSPRTKLIVSMRSDRPLPPLGWVDAVKQMAAIESLSIVVVVQVLRDRKRAGEIAELLGAEYQDWDGTEPGRHELLLRETYRAAALAVSDRLHVLIGATTEGAAPAALTMDRADKIDRHFEAIGVFGVTRSVLGAGEPELLQHLKARLVAGPAVMNSVEDARLALANVRVAVSKVISR